MNENQWHKALRSTFNIDGVVQNVKKSVDGILQNDGICLKLSKTENGVTKFGLKAVECKERQSVVCRKNSISLGVESEPSRFPCMAKTYFKDHNASRKKRNDNFSGMQYKFCIVHLAILIYKKSNV